MRLANMTWVHSEEYFKANDTVIIAVGSIESHGRHLPLGTDTLIPDRILELIERQNDSIMICPTIPYGATDAFMGFSGTVSLGLEGLYTILSAVVNSMWKHGARKFIILNGHGGNIKTIEKVGLDVEEKGGILACLNWWLMAWDMKPEWKGGHGGAEETAAIMGIDPSLVIKNEIGGELELKSISDTFKMTGFNTVNFKGVNVNIIRKADSITDNGWIGPDHPSLATVEWGEEMLQASADYISDFANEFKKIKLG